MINYIIRFLQETYIRFKGTSGLGITGWEKLYHVKNNQRRAAVAMLISTKQIVRQKLLLEKLTMFYNKKQSTHQEDKNINIYTPK